MKFEVLKPKDVGFTLEVGGRKVNMTLRPFNLADEAFIRETLTAEEQIKAADNLDIIPWIPVIWNQLDNDSKKVIAKIKVVDVDKDGNEFEKQLEGHEKLATVLNVENVLTLFDALLKARRISVPEIDEAKQAIKKNKQSQ